MTRKLSALLQCALFTTFCSRSFSLCRRRTISCGCGGGAIGGRASASASASTTPSSSRPSPIATTLWMHAVSVGEVNVCTQLIRALEPRLPNLKIVVSTTTTTGMGELQKKLPTHISKIYYPIDRRSYVSRALSTVRPEAIVLVEAEIWPNFIWRARDMGMPVFLVNARLSERSYRGYRRFGFLFRPLFAAFTGVGAQNEADAAELRELGCRPGGDPRRWQLEVRRRETRRNAVARRPGDAAPGRRDAGRAPARRRQHACGRGSHPGRAIPPAARAVPGFVSGAGAAPFRAQPGGGPRIARARA